MKSFFLPRLTCLALCAGLLCSSLPLSVAATSKSAPALLKADAQGAFHLGRALEDYYDYQFILPDAKGRPRAVDATALAAELDHYDVVLFGEFHRHPGVHLAQQQLYRALLTRHPKVLLSLEQFERDVQPVLDDYLAGRIGDNALVDKGRAWDNYRTSYRPLVETARARGLPVIAAEAPTWAISCIGQQGKEVLSRFSAEERATVAADLYAPEGAYREKYLRFQSGAATHGGGAAPTPAAIQRAERSLAAQAARDDTMAESIHLALQRNPGYKVLHLNGAFHSDGFLGTAEELRRRNPALRIAVIAPLEAKDAKTPTLAPAALKEGSALLLAYPSAPDFAEGEDKSDWIRKVMAKRTANPCKYTLDAAVPAPAPAPAAAPAVRP